MRIETTKGRAKTPRAGRLAVCTDEEIVVGPTLRFGEGGIGGREEEAARETLGSVEDDDDLFFANMDFAAAMDGAASDGEEERISAPMRAPLGFFDMTADERPLPSAGVVVAKNASSRDAVVFAENEEGAVVAWKWPRGETIALRDGKLDKRRPPSPKGGAMAYAPYMYYVTVARERDDGTTATMARYDVDVATVPLPKVEEEDFPLAFVTEETIYDWDRGKVETRREIRAWDGRLWSAAPPWRPADETKTVERLERDRRVEAAFDWREAADSTVERDATAFAKEARLARKDVYVIGDDKARGREQAGHRLTRGLPTIVRGETTWREIGEPRYVVYRKDGGISVSLTTNSKLEGLEILPATMSKEEASAYVKAKYGSVTEEWTRGPGVTSVEVVDPRFVTVAKPRR